MADERVRILLEAKDNASATINKVNGSLSNMQPQASGLAGVFGKLTPVLGMAAGAFAAVFLALRLCCVGLYPGRRIRRGVVRVL